jgi:FdrA protein
MSWDVRVVRDRYADSVRLMGVARGIRGREGVEACEVAMGTAANLEALAALGVTVDAGPGDVVIAVRAGDGGVRAAALADAEAGLTGPSAPAGGGDAAEERPRTLTAAVAAAGGANVALVSVPGEYATLESHRALGAGLHVFLFSDHVSLEDEVALKRRGEREGLLVMGPGCGTAMLGGVGLGFMNVVRRGPVGIVAAAGTGAQEAACLLEAAGAGVSQIVGVGGRDLSAEVGGIMFRQGMRMLAEDPATETLLLVSKPPAPEVVRGLADAVPPGVRVLAAFVGWEGGPAPFEVHATLEAGAYAAAGVAPPAPPAPPDDAPWRAARGRALLALYSGGSLAHEALTILEPALGAVAGNVAHHPGDGPNTVLDLGEEEYTRGRPHPMVDLTVRLEMLERAGRDEGVGCVLLDVVLGHGAHPDPASELAPALAALTGRIPVVAHVCGTAADPQDLHRQETRLREAGVLTCASNAAAARLAAAAVTGAA